MSVYFNVTDAIGAAPNHGITRTERRLASELSHHSDVSFVAMHGGRLYGVDRDDLRRAVDGAAPEASPSVELFGVDRSSRGRSEKRIASLLRRSRDTVPGVALAPISLAPDAVLVSVGLDWVHGFVDVARRHVFGAGGRYVGFCYDLIPIDHPEWLFPPDPVGFRRHLRTVVDSAKPILCISENTRRDLLRHFPDLDPAGVHVLRLGADAAVDCEPRHHAFAASLFDGAPFAVYCATIDRRKNHQLLYRVVKEWARRGDEGNVVFVGRLGSGVDDLVDCLRHDPLVAGRIAHISNCDDAHLAALYRRAAVAVYPSLYEGWGLGVTEALAHGTPCLIASGSSLEEAGLGVCEVLHPLQTSHWVERIASHLTEPRGLPPVDLPTWRGTASDLLRLAAT